MSLGESGNRFSLTAHVHACLTDEHLVFMDLRADRYCCLAPADTQAVLPVLEGSVPASGMSSRSAELLRQLIDSRLLTTSHDGKALAAPCIRRPECELRADSPHEIPTASIAKFFVAAAATAVRLRSGRLDRTFARLTRKKTRGLKSAAPRSLTRLARTIGIFQALRPIYPKPYVCLFDSLALFEFLAYDGLFPTLVFGVKMRPWSAHCWLQEGSYVLNDTVDRVRDYTPILAV